MHQPTYMAAARKLGAEALTRLSGTSLDDPGEIYALAAVGRAAATLIEKAAAGETVTALTPDIKRRMREELRRDEKVAARQEIDETLRILKEDVVAKRYLFIPAAPGYEMLGFHAADAARGDEEWIEREAVICWRLDLCEAAKEAPSEYSFKPLGLWQGASDTVLLPTGQVIELGDQLFDNFDAWLASERQRAIDEKEREADKDKPRLAAAFYLGMIEHRG